MAKKYPDTAEKLAALSLDAVNAEINRLRVAYEDADDPADRKALFDRLLWVEAVREELHMIPPKARKFVAQKAAPKPKGPPVADPESGESD
ncbi:hypothetical protein QO010_003215 [Caulobacter ginsengisoli]|uniref:Uncharacterized protein n=1 Tax=Caulobacter ginsengisoli TaxID=400775 RepID=A0ABU0ITU5_9CAUL|nr:hypothetical protein [Caulobacter ginsengisoli]MDQ0465428.1 hypothetical protein [Caulobacter ginsengisoli]